MSYVESNLLPNERVVHRSRLSRVIFAGPLVFVLWGALLAISAASQPKGAPDGMIGSAVVLILIGLIFAAGRYVDFATSEFAVTDRRVIIKVGVIRRRTLELQLAKVETIAVNQGIFGRLFGYGNIIVTGTGGTKEPFKRIRAALEFRRAVQAATA